METVITKESELNSADTFINHLSDLVKPTKHRDLLQKLIEQIEPIDFRERVYTHVKKLKKTA